MAVEIKELVIRLNATTPEAGSRGGGTSATAPQLLDQEALVEACVKQVLKILEKKKSADMDLPNPFKLERLKIKAVDQNGRDLPGNEPFEAMFNPALYTITYRNRQQHQRTLDPLSHQAQPAGQEPHTFGVKLLLDGTGVTESSAMFSIFGALTTSVEERVKKIPSTLFYR